MWPSTYFTVGSGRPRIISSRQDYRVDYASPVKTYNNPKLENSVSKSDQLLSEIIRFLCLTPLFLMPKCCTIQKINSP